MTNGRAANDVTQSGDTVSPGGVAGAIGLSVVGVAAFSVLPLTVGALAELPGLNEARAGYVASADLFGFAAMALAAVFWVGRIKARQAAAAGLTLAVAGNLLCLGAPDFAFLLGARLLAGAGAGTVYAVALSTLTRAPRVDRAFGLMVAAQISFQVIALLVLSRLVAVWGTDAIFLALAGVASLAWLGITQLPGLPGGSPDRSAFRPRTRGAWFGLGAVALFSLNIAAVWAYVELIGLGAGLTAPYVATVLAASLALSVLGALGAAWLGDRHGRRAPFILAVAVQLLALSLLIEHAGAAAFAFGAVLYSLVWAFAVPFLYTTVASHDTDGRLIVLAPAAQAFGASVGPMLAALTLSSGSFIFVNGLAATALLGALVCVLVATR